MSALTLPARPPAGADLLVPLPEYLGRLRPFTPDEYDRMVTAGLLTTADKVELLEGHVVQKWPRRPPHDFATDALGPNSLVPLPEYLGRLRPFTPDEYDRMGQLGVLAEGERVELIDGHVVFKMPQNHPHDFALDQLVELLRHRLPVGWRMRGQQPLRCSTGWPEPDLAIVRSDPAAYRQRRVEAGDAAALIEVAATSLATDQGAKLQMYARAGVPVYWVVNLDARQVEVYTLPTGDAYAQQDTYAAGDLVPLVLDGQVVLHVAVDDLLL